MNIIKAIYLLFWYGVTVAIIGTITLMLLRLLVTYVDVNPFSWSALTIRRFTDPLVSPVRRALAGFGVDPKISPFVTILLAILLGWFSISLAETILNTAAGILRAAQAGALVAIVGYVLYGLLALFSLFIFIRIIFSWGMVGRSNRVMRFLMDVTDPLLVPLRRIVPPLGMFDLSPIVAFFIIWLFQAAIAGTLLKGLPIQFLG